ncbi:MAG: hypothetical protein Q4G48_10000 [Bacteroidia bacterium]|nr:hypothetical protein [Bacteroidia bacterium]
MSQGNKISFTVDEAKLASVREKLAALQTDLADVLIVNLTPEERQNLLIMGSKTIDFVTRALGYAQQNPNLTPPYIDLPEAQKDLSLVRNVMPVLQELRTLTRGLEDTVMVAGSEAYDAALIFYASVKGASRTDVPGAQAVHDDLKRQFPNRGRKKADTPPTGNV